MEISSIGNIPYLSTVLSQNDLLSQVGVSMLSQSLDMASAEMSDLTKAMELSVNPAIGSNFDVSI